jgi:hypothetical protein
MSLDMLLLRLLSLLAGASALLPPVASRRGSWKPLLRDAHFFRAAQLPLQVEQRLH